MNKLPIWRAIVMVVALAFGLLYTLPNFFGEAPAVQVSSAKSTVKVDQETADRVSRSLQIAGIAAEAVALEGTSVRIRLPDTDTQLKAKDAIDKALNTDPKDPRFVVALNLVSSSPGWLSAMRALPMYLGLDLRGGVHFLMQVDTRAVAAKRIQSTQLAIRSTLVEKKLRFAGISRAGDIVEVRFRERETLDAAITVLSAQMPELALREQQDAEGLKLVAQLSPESMD